jgi:competence protein ComEA
VIAVVVLLIGWQVVSGRPSAAPAGGSPGLAIDAGPSSQSPDTAGGSDTDAAGEALVIDVVGHVHRPGIVILPPGSRVHEAIEAAGGLTGPVDTTALNMARKLTDGEQILVGIAPVAPAGGGANPDGSGAPAGGLINLNTATEAELDDLPGVGPVTAASILEWRQENGQFSSVDDLLEVRGIGEATLEDLRDHATV